MRKIIVVIIVALLGQVNINAQEKAPEMGDFSGWSANLFGGFSDKYGGVYIRSYGIGFYPRYNFLAPKEWVSASVGAPLMLGFQAATSSTYGSYFTFLTEVPVVLDMNIGCSATEYANDIGFGAFFGGGFGFNYLFLSSNGNYNFPSVGPYLHAGLKWKMYGNITGIRIAYLAGVGGSAYTKNGLTFPDSNPDVLSYGVIYSF